jgi:lysophospholipid acyltransferase
MTVWSRVYYYGIVGTFSSMVFFASPAKAYLVKQVKRRSSRPRMARSVSTESIPPTTLGLPNDPEQDLDEVVQEIKSEIESRRRRGSVVTMPTGEELKIAVEQKIGRKL